MLKTCCICGKVFEPKHGKSNCCSEECKAIRNKNYRRNYNSKPRNRNVRKKVTRDLAASEVTLYERYRRSTSRLDRLAILSTATYAMGEGLSYGQLTVLCNISHDAFERLEERAVAFMRNKNA